jgi:hypothetical protein
MKADLTRNTLAPFKHFSRVLMQQGRVQLDADWNEQAGIVLRSVRGLAADLIGPAGGPKGHVGFELQPVPIAPAIANDVRIGLGRYYVDGILCEADSEVVPIVAATTANGRFQVTVDHFTMNGAAFAAGQLVELFDDVRDKPAFPPTVFQVQSPDPTQLTLALQGAVPATLSAALAPRLRRVITYATQPHYPLAASDALVSNAQYLLYLDVWERLITYVEDDRIREVALGGPDTAARSQVIWQVKAIRGQPGSTNANQNACQSFTPADPGVVAALDPINRGRLKARARQSAASTDPCIISPSASFRGPENQLYRVEIHAPGPGAPSTGAAAPPSTTATFKWSRDNGSVVFPITSLTTGNGQTTVKLERLGRDDRLGLEPGEWIEVVDDAYVLQNRASPLLQVLSVDRPSRTVILNGIASAGQDPALHPLLRRWDHQAGDPAEGGLQIAADGAAFIIEGAWLTLEAGVQIQFQPGLPGLTGAGTAASSANRYLTGDYWLIPARTATGDVEWPREKDAQGNLVPIARGPDGVEHHRAFLGVIGVGDNGAVTRIGDCRLTFAPLAV